MMPKRSVPQGAETGFGWNKGAKFSPYYDDISFMAGV